MPDTRYLMISSAAVLALMGLAVAFAPVEFLGALGADASAPVPVLLKLMGGLYLGFALMNWSAKDNMIGGIYSRPVAIGNFLHFFVGLLSLGKFLVGGNAGGILTGVLVIYLAFGAWFGWLVFGQGSACAVASND